MPEKPKARPLSASRQRRRHTRRSSLNADIRPSDTEIESEVFVEGLDLRSTLEKLDSLKKQLKEREGDSTPEERLNALVLLQLYSSLEYGDMSIENGEACVNLSKFYLEQNFLAQAKMHILKARSILEQLNIKATNDNLIHNTLGFDVYLVLVKCAFYAKSYLSQRSIRVKNKHITAIDTTHIDHDLYVITEYLDMLRNSEVSDQYHQKQMEYLLIKFDIITDNVKEFNPDISSLIIDIIENIDKTPSIDGVSKKIDIYLRAGSYFVSFDPKIANGLEYYQDAVKLAEEQESKAAAKFEKHSENEKIVKSDDEQENRLAIKLTSEEEIDEVDNDDLTDEQDEPSKLTIKEKLKKSLDLRTCQLANVFFQWGLARVKVNRLKDTTERKLQRAIELYRKVNNENDRSVLKVMDTLATYYMKTKRFQDALNVLCDSLPDKKQFFGDFSDEVIDTESRIGAIYLRECEYLRAAEHLKECLDLQEFVYGPKDPRTCQTRDTLEIVKKDPTVSRTFFSQTQDGIRQDRPAFSLSSKVSHQKEDHQLLMTVTKKPPMSSRN